MANPRVRRFATKCAKALLQLPADALVVSSKRLNRQISDCVSLTDAVLENPRLSAKFHALEPNTRWFVVRKDAETSLPKDNGLAVPPSELHEGYGPSNERYLGSGREDFGKMMDIVRSTGYSPSPGHRILEFGCSAGRLIRHFADIADKCEVRGVDISARHIKWAQEHLTPFRFTTSTTFPHLPFEDGYFDFIYSGSVFTHISDLADMWLLELRRILKVGGWMYATVHDDQCIEVLRRELPDYFLTRLVNEFHSKNPIFDTSYRMFSLYRSAQDAMVFYHRDYLREAWGREMKILKFVSKAYGYQSAVVLQK